MQCSTGMEGDLSESGAEGSVRRPGSEGDEDPERSRDRIWKSGQEMPCWSLHDCGGEEWLGKAQERSRMDPTKQNREDMRKQKPVGCIKAIRLTGFFVYFGYFHNH